MIQEDLLTRITHKLNHANIPYMMAGGIAAIFFGRPRLTHDFDIIIEVGLSDIKKLTDAFGKDFYLDEQSIREAVKDKSFFNMIHTDSGIKADFWLLQDDDFDRKRFERRQKHVYQGEETYFSSPEDIILKKLLWFKESEIEKHLDDALGILEVQKDLDEVYLQEWAGRLQVSDLLDELLGQIS